MKKISIEYTETEHLEALPVHYKQLILAARQATTTSYAPYSNFYVGACLLLTNGTLIKGSNQENGAYPSGLCAERTALFAYGSQNPDEKIECIAIAATRNRSDFLQCPPCGACRQVMMEYEAKQRSDIKVLFSQADGKIVMFNSVKDLMPFAFLL